MSMIGLCCCASFVAASAPIKHGEHNSPYLVLDRWVCLKSSLYFNPYPIARSKPM